MNNILILLAAFFPALLPANNTPPVANATTHLNRWVIYPGEEAVVLNAAASFDGDGGAIQSYNWFIKKGSTTLYNTIVSLATFSIALPALANPSTDENVFTCSLRVKDNENTWSGWKVYTLAHRHSVSIYYLTDHIGNVRATVDHQGNLVGYDDYDPFGLVLPGRSANIGDPKDIYKFTGHERDAEIGLDYMLARNYDPEIGRFLSVDPSAGSYPGWSPYHYSANNPINITDPTGKDWYKGNDGSVMWRKGSEKIDNYENLGASYTHTVGNYSITYNQSEAYQFSENYVDASAFSSQHNGVNNDTGKFIKKDGAEGNCKTHADRMTKSTGAESMGGNANNAKNPVEYASNELNKGKGTTAIVPSSGSSGVHFITITGKTTDVASGKVTSFRFADPAALSAKQGFGVLKVKNGTAAGTASYNSDKPYVLKAVRKNR